MTMADNEDAWEMSMDLGEGFIQATLPELVQSEDIGRSIIINMINQCDDMMTKMVNQLAITSLTLEKEEVTEDEISEIEEGVVSIVKELVEELVVNGVNGSGAEVEDEIESMSLVLESSSDEEEVEKELEKEVEIEELSTSLENKKKTFKRKRKNMKEKGNTYSKSGIV